jgi:hypothetical protein
MPKYHRRFPRPLSVRLSVGSRNRSERFALSAVVNSGRHELQPQAAGWLAGPLMGKYRGERFPSRECRRWRLQKSSVYSVI